MAPDQLTLRLHGRLADLGGGRTVAVPARSPRSVKDAVESVGVPHTEIGLLRVDGASVGFDRLVRGGERVEVRPAPVRPFPADGVHLRPPVATPVRFVADVHLGTLTRRLRTLGFDTWWANDADDALLARVAVEQDRILLTRDRGLLMRRVVVHGHLPHDDDPDRQLDEVVDRFGLGDQAKPLTRCIRCNGGLLRVAKQTVMSVLPPATRREHDRFVRCDDCGQVYWPGSHRHRLDDVVRSTVDD